MWRNAALLFAAQDGVTTRAQLHAAGVSDSMIAARVRAGEIVRIRPACCAPNITRTTRTAGWSVLSFSWHHLHDDPEGVITILAEAIGARAA
ncbi:type IV toxin-antitoxin system AbiEi family antitoxin domain-containing protein [Tsukamurella serpentis]